MGVAENGVSRRNSRQTLYLTLRIKRGVNLAVRDRWSHSSDPYVVVTMGKEELPPTRVVKKTVNPEWNQDFNLTITDPHVPIKLAVYDKDTFTRPDEMGYAEIDKQEYIKDFTEKLEGRSTGRKVVKDLDLKLKDVESGVLKVQLQWTA